MVWKAINLSGLKFAKLTVIERIGTQGRKPMWRCLCDCGNETQAISANLKSGNVKSCGCLMRDKVPRIIKNCKVCDKEIKIKPSHVNTEGSYCSKVCMAKDYENRFNGKDNPNHRHGLSHTKEYKLPYTRSWRNTNKEKVRASSQRIRAKRAKAKGTHNNKDIKTKLWLQDNKCYWCFEDLNKNKYEIDHVVPLSKGGSNCKDNIVISCNLCNRQKHSQFVLDWYSKENCRAKRQDICSGKYSAEITCS